nr:bifunctional nitrilase/nitrile hydratase nit4 [Quercus suber]
MRSEKLTDFYLNGFRFPGLVSWKTSKELTLFTEGIGIYFRPTAEAREIWQATMIHIAQEVKTICCQQKQLGGCLSKARF